MIKFQSDPFAKLLHTASSNVDILASAKELAKKYKECLEEIIRRRGFFANLKLKINDFNEILAHFRNEELDKRKVFLETTVGESVKNRDILVNQLFPVLVHSLPQISLEASGSKIQNAESPSIWTKELMYEVEHLPKLQKEDVVDASWVNLQGTLLVSTNAKQTANLSQSHLDDAHDVESDEEDNGSLSNASQHELVEALNHKDKEIEGLKKSLTEAAASREAIAAKDGQIAQLTQSAIELQKTIEELTKVLQATKEQSLVLENRCKQHQVENTDLQKQLQQIKTGEMEKQKLMSVVAELQEMKKSQTQEKDAEINSLRTQLRNVERLAKEQTEYAAQKTKEFETLSTIHTHVKNSKDTAEKRVAELTKQLQTKSTDTFAITTALNGERVAWQKERNTLVDKLKQVEITLVNERDMYEAKLATAAKEKERELNDIIMQYSSEQERLTGKHTKCLQEKDSKIAALEATITTVAKQLEAEQAAKKKATEVVQQYAAEAEILRAALKEQQTKFMQQLQSKPAPVQQVPSSTSALRPNEIKIAVSDFQIDDIVFFKRKSKTEIWEVFNSQSPFYFLSDDAVKMLKQKTKTQYDTLEFIKAQILYVDDVKATKDNAYGLPVNQTYHIVHIYPFDK